MFTPNFTKKKAACTEPVDPGENVNTRENVLYKKQ